jgi:formate dehydrogenase subunit beta
MDRLRAKVRNLLKEGKVAGYLGYKMKDGHPLPHFFTPERLEEVEEAIVAPDDARYPLDKLLQQLASRYPEATFAIQVRGCFGPWASVIDYGEKCEPVSRSRRVDRIDALAGPEAFQEWLTAFNRCIKCYGCRDVCPMCFCKECALEHPDLMSTGKVPPDTIFQLVRAIHMAGRCIDCGLCEENCPADIPLRVLYKKGNALVKELFGYETGSPESGLSPWKFLGEESTLETKPM